MCAEVITLRQSLRTSRTVQKCSFSTQKLSCGFFSYCLSINRYTVWAGGKAARRFQSGLNGIIIPWLFVDLFYSQKCPSAKNTGHRRTHFLVAFHCLLLLKVIKWWNMRKSFNVYFFFMMLVRILFCFWHLLSADLKCCQIDPGTSLLFLTNEHNRGVRWLESANTTAKERITSNLKTQHNNQKHNPSTKSEVELFPWKLNMLSCLLWNLYPLVVD